MTAHGVCRSFVTMAALAASLAAPCLAVAAEPCRTVRGRMELYNGAPTVRIWVVGTKRIMGVHQEGAMFSELPANVRKSWQGSDGPEGHRLFGDFRVCPLMPRRAGRMDIVRVQSATNLRRD
jgi:hypothetical protein